MDDPLVISMPEIAATVVAQTLAVNHAIKINYGT